MKSTSLLTRIRKPELAGSRRIIPESELRQDVLNHLKGMCSTRLGTVLTRPDYGIPDVSELVHAFPGAIAMMQRALKHTIDTYEPRLSGVRVNYVPTAGADFIMRFEIVAQLATDTGKSAVKFETMVEMSRKLSVR